MRLRVPLPAWIPSDRPGMQRLLGSAPFILGWCVRAHCSSAAVRWLL